MAKKQITELRTTLSMDKDEFRRSAKETKADLRALKSEMNLVKASTDDYEDSLTGLKKQSDILNRTLKVQESQLASVKKKYDEAVKASGENSVEARKLQGQYNNLAAQIKKTESRLESVNSEIAEQGNKWKQLAKRAKEAGENVKDIGDKMQNVGQSLTQNVTAPIVGFGALAVETTREFREDLAKLNINAKQAGLGIDTTHEAMKNLNAITGETDSNVEALSNLMATGMNKNQLLQAVNDLSGAVIKFPDTLKIEGVADGLQETLATGKAIGPFAELLERMGVDLETFDEGLADAKESGDDLNYVLDELNKLDLSSVNKEFRETNKELVDAREAQYDFQASFAELGKKLEPIATRITEGLTDIIDEFNELEPETQDMIVKLAGFAVATGPAITGVGALTKASSGLFGTLSKVSGTIGKKGGGAGGKATLLGGLGALAMGSGPLALATAGIAGLTAGGIALYNHLKDEVVPEVDLFGDTVSESTKKAIGGFMDLNNEATVQLNELNWTGQEVTKEMAESLTTTFEEMGQIIVEGLQKRKDESIQALEELFITSKNLSQEEKTQLLEDTTTTYEERIKIVEEGNARITEILQNASEENRERTKAEEQEINQIRQRMEEFAIETLSESEKEQNEILTRMQEQASAITTRQASEVIKNSAKAKEKTIQDAEERYFSIKSTLEAMSEDLDGESKKQVENLIKDAERQRDETIKKAEDMHQGVITEAKEQNPKLLEEVNVTTGEILSYWDELQVDVVSKLSSLYQEARIVWSGVQSIFSQKISIDAPTIREPRLQSKSMPNWFDSDSNADGTSYFNHPSGLSWLGEKGYELVNHGNKWALADFGLYSVPQGAQIFTHNESKKILRALNNIPGHASGASPPGEADRIAARLNQPQQLQGQAVIYTTVINQMDSRELGRHTYKSVTEFQNRSEFIKNKFRG